MLPTSRRRGRSQVEITPERRSHSRFSFVPIHGHVENLHHHFLSLFGSVAPGVPALSAGALVFFAFLAASTRLFKTFF